MDPEENILQKYRIPIGLSIVGLVLIIAGVFSSGINRVESTEASSKDKQFPKESLVGSQEITVDVSGAINSPGVYKLKEGDRIAEAIGLAGGFKADANSEYISKYLNMAQKLVDGTKIYIPYQGEAAPVSAGQGQVAGVNSSASININSSTQSELESLPGIGPVTASKIISGRPYQKVDDLLSKKIVSKAVFEKIKESIVVY